MSDIRDFGAVGDGVTDDTDVIQAVLDAAGEGDLITVSMGTYQISQLNLTAKTGVRFRGDGGKFRLRSNATQTVGTMGITAIKMEDCQGCQIDGIRADGALRPVNLVGLLNCTDTVIERCEVYNGGHAGLIVSIGGLRNSFKANHVHDSVAGSTSSRGMWIGNVNSGEEEEDVEITGNRVHDCVASGIVIIADGGRVSGNQVNNVAGAGIVPGGLDGVFAKHLIISGNTCQENAFHGIQADPFGTAMLSNASILGNVCTGNTFSGIYVYKSSGLAIVGNQCLDNNVAGITILDNVLNTIVSGNNCGDTRSGVDRTQEQGITAVAQADSMSGISISGNTCVNNIEDGIRVLQNAPHTIERLTVVGNQCHDNGVYGIRLVEETADAISNSVVDLNVCNGNSTTDLRLSATAIQVGADNVFGTFVGP